MTISPAPKALAADAAPISTVPLDKAYRLINHGPVVMVSASHGGVHNVMSVAWACALDFNPPRVTVVIDKGAYTRQLVEHSGRFVLQVPCAQQAALVMAVGGRSRHTHEDKLEQLGVQLFSPEGSTAPLVRGCVAWLECRLIPEPHNQQTYDLFIGEVQAAWADARVFRSGHWEFDTAPPALHTIHYVAGQQFYRTGEGFRP